MLTKRDALRLLLAVPVTGFTGLPDDVPVNPGAHLPLHANPCFEIDCACKAPLEACWCAECTEWAEYEYGE